MTKNDCGNAEGENGFYNYKNDYKRKNNGRGGKKNGCVDKTKETFEGGSGGGREREQKRRR